jgi:hypothetical protein
MRNAEKGGNFLRGGNIFRLARAETGGASVGLEINPAVPKLHGNSLDLMSLAK